jgi:hypothetical protein
MIVLSVRTVAREDQPGLLAIRFHRVVHEHTVVVRIETEQGERHPLAHRAQRLGRKPLLPDQHRRALRPSHRDVRQRQSMHVAAIRGGPAMRHEFRLGEPGRRVVPISEGAHRNNAPDHGRRRSVAALAHSRPIPDVAQDPINRGRAHASQRVRAKGIRKEASGEFSRSRGISTAQPLAQIRSDASQVTKSPTIRMRKSLRGWCRREGEALNNGQEHSQNHGQA